MSSKKVQDVIFQWPSLCLFIYLILFHCLSLFCHIFHVFISTFSLYYSSFVSIVTCWFWAYYLFLVITVFSALFQCPASLCFVAHLLALLSLLFISNFFLCPVVCLDAKLTYLASWDDIRHAVCRRLAQLMITFSCNHVKWMPVGWQRGRFPPAVHQSVTNFSFAKAWAIW